MNKDIEYVAIVEACAPAMEAENITENRVNGQTRSLRFTSCLQSFDHLNRNRRLWHSSFMKEDLKHPHIQEMIKNHTWAGENGHPIPATGQASVQRIGSIDPNNICHLILGTEWRGNLLFGTIETIDDGEGRPGTAFMRNIIQGMNPSFSLRALAPQVRRPNGTIDVTGHGRVITYDRVILPSHQEAYRDISVPIREIVKKADYQQVMESVILPYIVGGSDRMKYMADMAGAMEGASYNPKTGRASVRSKEGNTTVTAVFRVEDNVRRGVDDILKQL